jgi:hypothetical protein
VWRRDGRGRSKSTNVHEASMNKPGIQAPCHSVSANRFVRHTFKPTLSALHSRSRTHTCPRPTPPPVSPLSGSRSRAPATWRARVRRSCFFLMGTGTDSDALLLNHPITYSTPYPPYPQHRPASFPSPSRLPTYPIYLRALDMSYSALSVS